MASSKNYQIALVKPYFETGLKELAKACKYPLAAIKSCSQFKRSHNFILEAWESVYRVMVERFTESSNAPLTTDCVAQAMKDITSAGANKGDTSKLINNIASFKAVFSESNFFDKLKIFVNELSSKDPTWKFWSQFVFKDALAYVALFLAIRSGDWDLKMASVRLMAPIFSAYDHLNYSKLIARHISDVLALPTSIIIFQRKMLCC